MQLLNAARPEPACSVESGTGGRRGLLLLLCLFADLLLIRIYAVAPSCDQCVTAWAHGHNLQPQEGAALHILHAALHSLRTVCA